MYVHSQVSASLFRPTIWFLVLASLSVSVALVQCHYGYDDDDSSASSYKWPPKMPDIPFPPNVALPTFFPLSSDDDDLPGSSYNSPSKMRSPTFFPLSSDDDDSSASSYKSPSKMRSPTFFPLSSDDDDSSASSYKSPSKMRSPTFFPLSSDDDDLPGSSYNSPAKMRSPTFFPLSSDDDDSSADDKQEAYAARADISGKVLNRKIEDVLAKSNAVYGSKSTRQLKKKFDEFKEAAVKANKGSSVDKCPAGGKKKKDDVIEYFERLHDSLDKLLKDLDIKKRSVRKGARSQKRLNTSKRDYNLDIFDIIDGISLAFECIFPGSLDDLIDEW